MNPDKVTIFTTYLLTGVTFVSVFLGFMGYEKILAIFLISLMSFTVLSMVYFGTKAIINDERDIMQY